MSSLTESKIYRPFTDDNPEKNYYETVPGISLEGRIHDIVDSEGRRHQIIFHRPLERLNLQPIYENNKTVYGNFDLDKIRNEHEKREYTLYISKTSGNVISRWGYLRENTDVEEGSVYISGNKPLDIQEMYEVIKGPTIYSDKEFSQQEKEALEIRDTNLIIAASIINQEGTTKKELDDEAYSLYWRMLSGDEDAEAELNRRLEILKSLRSKETIPPVVSIPEYLKPYELGLDDLVLVHKTDFLPENSRIMTTYDNTGIPRGTVHFSLNGSVASHAYGDWSSRKYVIISPLDTAIDLNGLPSVMNTVDTFFTTYPGKGLVLPEGHLILCPEDDSITISEDKLYERIGDKVYYRTSFSPAQAVTLLRKLPEKSKIEESILVFIKRSFESNPSANDIINVLFTNDTKFISTIISNDGDISGYFEKLFQILPEDVRVEKIEEIKKFIENILTTSLIEEATKDTIKSMGYEHHGGGPYHWINTNYTEAADILAQNLGLTTGLHYNHISKRIEKVFLNQSNNILQTILPNEETDTFKKDDGLFYRMLNGEIYETEFQRALFQIVLDKFLYIDEKTLHMLHDMGCM